MNTTETNEIDVELVKELVLVAENDGHIYESCGKYCIQNLQKKIKRGVFDENKAPRLFQLRYLDMARESYNRNTGFPITRMNKNEKELFGKLAYESFKEQIHGVTA